MGARTIRLDEHDEQVLAAVRARTGLSVSEALRRGLLALSAHLDEDQAITPYDVFQELDPGPGGEALAPGRTAKEAIRAVLKKKAGR
ncbi:MAG: hypothetical protein AB1578_02460 [Thermodesulfobacteriota bacterium]|jgi:hypothetical protein